MRSQLPLLRRIVLLVAAGQTPLDSILQLQPFVHSAAQYGVKYHRFARSPEGGSRTRARWPGNRTSGRVHFIKLDDRGLHGCVDRIASAGMFEHVGRHRRGDTSGKTPRS